jgi:hypothetical protein
MQIPIPDLSRQLMPSDADQLLGFHNVSIDECIQGENVLENPHRLCFSEFMFRQRNHTIEEAITILRQEACVKQHHEGKFAVVWEEAHDGGVLPAKIGCAVPGSIDKV